MIEAVFLDFYGTLGKWAPDAAEMPRLSKKIEFDS